MRDKPVLIEPLFFEHIWGGRLLKNRFQKEYDGKAVGESWELSVNPKGVSVVASGIYEGICFDKYYREVLGNDQECSILIKLLGPEKNLSVQVHPDDSFHGMKAKREVWYIVSAPENGKLIAGINCSRKELRTAIENGSVTDNLCYINCHAGDVIEIKPGMVHALLKDTIAYELQQNSDVTFRIFDWNRIDKTTGKPRELHIGHAMNLIDSELVAKVIPSIEHERQLFIKNEKFSLEKIIVFSRYEDPDSLPCAITVIEGYTEIKYKNEKLFDVRSGQTFYAPKGGVEFVGNATILKAVEAKDYYNDK